jgi:hypothetical protein
MLRELFPFAFTSDEAPNSREASPVETSNNGRLPEPRSEPRSAPEHRIGGYASFEEVYRSAPVKSSKIAYTILKIAEMTASTHLAGMSPEAKRSSVLMALEAAAMDVDALLQDAMVRQRALNDYEEALQRRLKDFEAGKIEENRQVQTELDRLTAEHIGRIQANLDELARQQDQFRAWQKDKQHEARRISDAAAICVPQNAPSKGDSVALVLERVTVQRH